MVYNVTTWTSRSITTEAGFLEGPIKLEKRSDFFYEGVRGKLGLLTLNRRVDNFVEMAGTSFPGDFPFGRRTDNFISTFIGSAFDAGFDEGFA